MGWVMDLNGIVTALASASHKNSRAPIQRSVTTQKTRAFWPFDNMDILFYIICPFDSDMVGFHDDIGRLGITQRNVLSCSKFDEWK